MRILVSGSHGLIGGEVLRYFRENGHDVVRLVREQSPDPKPEEKAVVWNYKNEDVNPSGMEGFDVVIHLAGVNIAGKRWDERYKKRIYNSRVNSTEFLVRELKKLKRPPKVFLCASAVGYYGSSGPEKAVDEDSKFGADFLAKVCRDWEKETKPAKEAGVRVVNLRFGVVLSKKDGALKQMLPPFKWGLGGRLGSGKQMMSWIALREIPAIMDHIIGHEEISGPVNVVTPNPVSNKEFTKTLGKVLSRPTIFPVPSFGVKALFGEMGETLLLNGAKVLPKRLKESGYSFRHPYLESALKKELES